jgi:hypothetical protein
MSPRYPFASARACAATLGGTPDIDRNAEIAAPAGPPGSPVEGRTTVAVVLQIQREVIHHGAEIALLRDLYAAG